MSIDRQDIKHFGIIFGVAALLCGGVWIGVREVHHGMNQEMVQLRQKLGLNQGSDSLERLKDQVVLLETQFAKQANYVPNTPETGAVHAAISQSLQDLTVQGQEISTEPAKQYLRYGTVPVRVGFESDFVSVHRFVDRIEQSPRLIEIERLEIETDPRREGRLRVTLDLRAYYSDSNASENKGDIQ